jgi:lysophospholipase L1-like esterase
VGEQCGVRNRFVADSSPHRHGHVARHSRQSITVWSMSIVFAALGDSTTVGVGDPAPDGTWRGWASHLAGPLGLRLHNVATSGARTVELPANQLPAALAAQPALASVVVGVNDTLRDRFEIAAIARALTTTVAALTDAGATVLTARLPDPGRKFGLPASLARPLARRMAAVNAVTDAVAVRYGTVHVDAAGHPLAYDRRMWSVDRLHPGERGHRLLARCFAEVLAARGFPVAAVPSMEPDGPPPTRSAQLRWMATNGTRWMLSRCTDLVPSLAAMAAAEWWAGIRGSGTRFDDRLRDDLAVAVAELEAPVVVA